MFALSTIGHCVPVPRQFDHFGVDLFVHFLRRVGLNVVSTGRVVTMQVKSTDELILVDTPEKRDCLYQSSTPFYIAVINKAEATFSLYTTLLKWITYWTDRNAPLCLIPGPNNGELPAGAGTHHVFLGEPIVRFGLTELENAETKVESRQTLFNVLELWTKWEQKHIVWREANLPFVACPAGYHTNEPFNTAHGHVDFMSFPDRTVLPAVEADLVTYLTGIRGYYQKLLEHAPAANPADDAPIHQRMHLVDAVIAELVGPEE